VKQNHRSRAFSFGFGLLEKCGSVRFFVCGPVTGAFASGQHSFAKVALSHLSALTAGHFLTGQKVTMGLSRDNGRQEAG
jgi:hypothetical protein